MRGQLFSYDLLISSIFVMLLLAMYVLSANSILSKMDDTELRAGTTAAAETAADSLLHTSGDPSNWELYPITETGTRSLGLADSSGELDSAKVNTFFAISNSSPEYDATFTIFGVQSGAYKYNATIETLDGMPLASLTRYPASTATNTVAIERFARLNGTVVKFRLVMWNE